MSLGYIDSQSFTDIADAIREKNGSSDTYTPSQMPQAILDIPTGGGGETEPGDITFYDWDGTILYKYSLEETHNLTSLPALPADYKDYHADSWTEELTTLQTTNVPMNVGINYTTTRQTNRLFITIEDESRLEVKLMAENGTEIDWGDGETTVSSVTDYNTHIYASPGDYVIETSLKALGTHQDYLPVIYSPADFTPSSSIAGTNLSSYNNSLLRWVELGDGCSAGNSNTNPGCFHACWNMSKILIPTTATIKNPSSQWSYGGGLKFSGIKFLSLPSTSPQWWNFTLQALPYLERFVFPSVRAYGSLVNNFFQYDNNLKDIIMTWPTTTMSTNTIPTSTMNRLERVAIKNSYSQGFNCNTGRPMNFKEIWFEEGLTICTGLNIGYCPYWDKVVFPSTLTTIDTSSVSLPREAHFKSVTPPSWSNMPTNLRCKIIYVPAESVEDYKTAWATYASIIQAEPTT